MKILKCMPIMCYTQDVNTRNFFVANWLTFIKFIWATCIYITNNNVSYYIGVNIIEDFI